ncbi:multidrug resistance protein [Thermoplasmatales archaeon]|nr:multidrug resistance protein [Thermoplasmatales archaeon]
MGEPDGETEKILEAKRQRRNLTDIVSARVLLSFSYGFLNVLLSLYLLHLGYSLLEIGVILGGAIIISAALTFLLAMLADHYGRKLVLIGLFMMFSIASLLFLSSKDILVLIVLSGIGGFTGSGGGPIGSGGPFGAVQTALITESTERREFSKMLSLASVMGIIAVSAGSFLIDLVEAERIDVYYLFYLAGILGTAGAVITVFLRDNGVRSRHILPDLSWRNIIKLSLPTIPSGIGVGFISPIFSLWFHLRFGISSGEIGIIFGLSNLFVLLVMVVLPRFIHPEKELVSIIWTRIVASVALVALAVIPVLLVAAVLYVLRQGMQMGAVPVRQSFAMGLVDPSERATTSGAGSMTRSGFSAASPPVAGSLLAINVAYPPLIGGIITIFDPFLYYFLFRKSFKGKKRDKNK